MPRRKKPVLARSTGVTLELPVIDFLDRMVSDGKAKDRSAVLNVVVREYAKKNGETIPSARIQGQQEQLNLRG